MLFSVTVAYVYNIKNVKRYERADPKMRYGFLHPSYGLGMVFGGKSYVRSTVRTSAHTSFTKCTTTYSEQTAGPRDIIFFCKNVCVLTKYLHLPLFIQIFDVLDLHFQGQKLEPITLGHLNVIISQTVTDRANTVIANT